MSAIILRPLLSFLKKVEFRNIRPRAFAAFAFLLALALAPASEVATSTALVEASSTNDAISPRSAIVSQVTGNRIIFESPALDLESRILKTKQQIAQIEVFNATKLADPSAIRLRKNLQLIEEAIDVLDADQKKLSYSPDSGFRSSTIDARPYVGQVVPTNLKLAAAHDPSTFRVRAIFAQSLANKLRSSEHDLQKIRIWRRGSSRPIHAIAALSGIEPAPRLPSPALARANKGPFAVSPTEDDALTPARPLFSAPIKLMPGDHSAQLFPGEIVTVEFSFDRQPVVYLVAKYVARNFSNLFGDDI